jgi:hypothetical protein
MAARSQFFPAVNFAAMRDGEEIVLPFTGELPYVIVSADKRVLNQREAGRELSYQIDAEAKTVRFLMVSNPKHTLSRASVAPENVGKRAAARARKTTNVVDMSARRPAAPPTKAIANQSLTQRERMLRSFWRECYVAAIASNPAATAADRANIAIADYESLLEARDRLFGKEKARG